MKRAIAFLGLALVAAGCGGKSGADTAAAPATGKPGPDEAKACIAAYMAQCGWKDVDVVRLADHPEVPKGANTPGTVWAFSFAATYTNVFGERQTTENWVAVIGRDGETARVTSCFDDACRLVGGHSGAEEYEKAVVTAPKP
jgi:hypothetical protein